MIKTRTPWRRMINVCGLVVGLGLVVLARASFASGLPTHFESAGSSSGGGGSSGSGSGGSGGGSDSSGSGSWGSGSGSWGSGSSTSGSGSSNSGSGDFSVGSGDTDSDSGSSNSGSKSSNSGSGSSDSGSGSSGRANDAESHFGDGLSWQRLAAREAPDFDVRGFPTRRGEIISLDLNKDQIEAVRKQGFSVIDMVKLPALDLVMVRLRAPKGMTAADAMKSLRSRNPELFYEFDHYFGVTGGGLDKSIGPDMVEMKVPNPKRLWIGIIDTAIWRQATLRPVRIEAQDFANRSGKPPFAHGTAVASVLARQGAVRLTSANIFAADGRPYSSAEAIARAVNWMVARKVPVINISVAGPQNALVDRVIALATARGHVVVAAAGNGGPSAPAAFPAASPGAIAVTAIDRSGRVYINANRGSYIEISAIGVGVGAEAPDGILRPHSGTSFAAPFVSAYLARCLETANAERSRACIKQMERSARDLGAPGRDPVYGFGMLVP